MADVYKTDNCYSQKYKYSTYGRVNITDKYNKPIYSLKEKIVY